MNEKTITNIRPSPMVRENQGQAPNRPQLNDRSSGIHVKSQFLGIRLWAPLRHWLFWWRPGGQLGCGVAAADPGYVANVIPCEQRTLVLSAFPAEADAVLAHRAGRQPVVVADRRRYYLGSISGKKVVVAMAGIGLLNATNTTETAFARFTCAWPPLPLPP